MTNTEQQPSIGKKIRSLRISRAMSQDELALKIGMDKTSVCFWETGRSTPTARSIKKLASVLKCKVEELTSCL